jgi:hypothetical protein
MAEGAGQQGGSSASKGDSSSTLKAGPTLEWPHTSAPSMGSLCEDRDSHPVCQHVCPKLPANSNTTGTTAGSALLRAAYPARPSHSFKPAGPWAPAAAAAVTVGDSECRMETLEVQAQPGSGLRKVPVELGPMEVRTFEVLCAAGPSASAA